jgi:hypothetical protein
MASLLCLIGLQPVSAQTTTFIDNVLAIFYVEVGATAYTLEFGLTVTGDNYDFGLLAAAETPVTTVEGAPTFDGSVLRVPEVAVGDTEYSLNLVLLSDNPVVFRLQSFAQLADPAPSSLQQAKAVFGESIETQVVQAKCIVCHTAGHPSGLAFTRSSSASENANFDAFSNYVNGMQSRRSRMLTMVQGIGHGGGPQLSQSSPDFAKFSEFLQLLVDHAAQE